MSTLTGRDWIKGIVGLWLIISLLEVLRLRGAIVLGAASLFFALVLMGAKPRPRRN